MSDCHCGADHMGRDEHDGCCPKASPTPTLGVTAMIRRWLTAHVTRTERRHQLQIVGLTRANIKDLTNNGLDPLGSDYDGVLLSARVGTAPDLIADHVYAAYLVTDRDPHITDDDALGLIARLHVWGIPHRHAAQLVADIARAAEGA